MKDCSKRLEGSNVLGDGSDGVETRALFLGGDQASHDHELLERNGISSRFCLKGEFSCKKDRRFKDQTLVNITHLIGHSDWEPPEFMNWAWIKPDLLEFMFGCLKDGHNKLGFCHQGARRAAAFMMLVIMVLTRCTGDEAYDYIKGLRDIVETNCIEVCRKFCEDRVQWLDWISDDDVVPLPCLVSPREMQDIFEGTKTIELERRCVKSERCALVDAPCCYSKYVLVDNRPAPSQGKTERPKKVSSVRPAPLCQRLHAREDFREETAMPQNLHTQPKAMPKRRLPENSVWKDPDQEDSSQEAPTPRATEIGENSTNQDFDHRDNQQ